MNEIPNNIAQTILEQAEREAQRRPISVAAHDGTPVEVVICNASADPIQAKLDAFALVPRSRAGKVEALDLDSFAALILRDYDAGSQVFADVSGPGVRFEAVLDYHRPVGAQPTIPGPVYPIVEADKARGGQRHGREIIAYAPALSDEWRAWTGQAGQAMSQGQFAAWIDEHLPDLADPRHLLNDPDSTAAKFGAAYGGNVDNLFGFADPDRMVKLSTGLSVRESSVVKNVVNLASGEVSIQYETEHADGDGRPLAVPRRFLISIPVFKREAAYLVPVKLAYRKKGGALEWTLDLFRSDRFRDDAIDGMRHDLEIKLIPEGGTAPVVPVHLAKRAG